MQELVKLLLMFHRGGGRHLRALPFTVQCAERMSLQSQGWHGLWLCPTVKHTMYARFVCSRIGFETHADVFHGAGICQRAAKRNSIWNKHIVTSGPDLETSCRAVPHEISQLTSNGAGAVTNSVRMILVPLIHRLCCETSAPQREALEGLREGGRSVRINTPASVSETAVLTMIDPTTDHTLVTRRSIPPPRHHLLTHKL